MKNPTWKDEHQRLKEFLIRMRDLAKKSADRKVTIEYALLAAILDEDCT